MTASFDHALQFVLAHRSHIKPCDPGILILYDEEGLRAHAPQSNPVAGKNMIKEAIVHAGMAAAEEGESCTLFTGTGLQATKALDAVFSLKWVRHHPDLPDVGTFFYVYPKGANNVEFCPIHLIFSG